MSLRKVNFVKGEYYHLYNRGNSKQIIFQDDFDYQYFVKLLYISNSLVQFKIKNSPKNIFLVNNGEQIVSIGAYCLMPNHFHILITPIEENGISKFMQKLTTGYSMYYNIKYKRSGSLFEGKFKSQYVGDDRYLKYLFSYIHLNPVKLIQKYWKETGIKDKIKILNFLRKYKYSSYLDYLGKEREEKIVLKKGSFPDYFPVKEKFQKEILEWISYNQ